MRSIDSRVRSKTTPISVTTIVVSAKIWLALVLSFMARNRYSVFLLLDCSIVIPVFEQLWTRCTCFWLLPYKHKNNVGIYTWHINRLFQGVGGAYSFVASLA